MLSNLLCAAGVAAERLAGCGAVLGQGKGAAYRPFSKEAQIPGRAGPECHGGARREYRRAGDAAAEKPCGKGARCPKNAVSSEGVPEGGGAQPSAVRESSGRAPICCGIRWALRALWGGGPPSSSCRKRGGAYGRQEKGRNLPPLTAPRASWAAGQKKAPRNGAFFLENGLCRGGSRNPARLQRGERGAFPTASCPSSSCGARAECSCTPGARRS